MNQHAANIGSRVFGDQFRMAGVEIDREEAGRIPIATVFEIERFAALIEAGRATGHGVFRTKFEEVFPLGRVAVLFRYLDDLAAGSREIHRKPDTEIVVGVEASDARILLDEALLPGRDVNP